MHATSGYPSAESANLATAWEELAERAAAPPFLRPAWLEPWAEAFGEQLVLVPEWRGRELVAVAAVLRRRGVIASPTNDHTAEWGVVAADEEARAALARRLVALAPSAAALHYLPADEPDLDAVALAAAAAGRRVVERARRQSPVLEIAGPWDEYEGALSKNLRGDVRRRRRRLDEEGAVEVEVVEEADPQVLTEGFRIEGSGWKDEQGTAIRSKRETLRFYTEIAGRAARHGWLRLCTLRLDGRAIAFHFNLEANGVLYHLKGGFDTEFERFSPGKLLHYALVERAFATGLRRYEFLGGDEPYKLQFASGVREYVLWEAYGGTPAGRAAWLLAAHGRPLAKRVLAKVRR